MRSIGTPFTAYANALEANFVNGAAAVLLTEDDLTQLGVKNRFHRLRLLGDIAILKNNATEVGIAASTSSSSSASASAAGTALNSSHVHLCGLLMRGVGDRFAVSNGAKGAAASAAASTAAAAEVKQCVVCLDRDRSLRFEPCGHVCRCKPCGDALSKCPNCQKPITAKQLCFLS